MNISRPGSTTPLHRSASEHNHSEAGSSGSFRLTSVDQARSYISQNAHFSDRLLAYCWREKIIDQAEKGELDAGSAELLLQAVEIHASTLPLPDTIKDKESAHAWLQQHIKTDEQMANLSLAFRESGCDQETVRLLAEAMQEQVETYSQTEPGMEPLHQMDPQAIAQLQENIALQFHQQEHEENPLNRVIDSVRGYTRAVGNYADLALQKHKASWQSYFRQPE